MDEHDQLAKIIIRSTGLYAADSYNDQLIRIAKVLRNHAGQAGRKEYKRGFDEGFNKAKIKYEMILKHERAELLDLTLEEFRDLTIDADGSWWYIGKLEEIIADSKSETPPSEQ